MGDSAPDNQLTRARALTSWCSHTRWKKKVRLDRSASVHASGTNRFQRVFLLPRDTPKCNGMFKAEDWLVDYTTAVGISNGNVCLAVSYVPLMLIDSART